MGWIETNLRRRIGFRYQIGPGASWRVWQSEGHLAKLSLTGTYESTQYNAVVFQARLHFSLQAYAIRN